MNIIPVIDILHGQVVRAVRGNRQTYAPMVSRLCQGSDPVTLARALVKHCVAKQLYVADLDALMGGPAQHDVLRALATALPDIELWLDAGFRGQQAADVVLNLAKDTAHEASASARLVPVYGSETLQTQTPYGPQSVDAILSLDILRKQRLGPASLWQQADRWPSRVIVMTLDRVGAHDGPDLDTLTELQGLSPHTCMVGAGGIRGAHDLRAAQAAGAQAWLVASALHDGLLP